MHIVSDLMEFLTRNIISCFEIHLSMSLCVCGCIIVWCWL